jgi:hypothetical protein
MKNHDLTGLSINTNLSSEGRPVTVETKNSIRIRASRFLTDRYAYRAQPNYVFELAAFGIIVVTSVWPIVLLAHALAGTLR